MSLKDNLKAKMKINRLTEKIISTLREVPGQRNVNKNAMKELLQMTDFEPSDVRDLHLYVRPRDGSQEVLVLDNELPIYHTSVEDVAMRRSPQWKEMLRIGNIKKVYNDQDVLISRGRQTIDRVHENALSRLDFAYTEEDVTHLLEDARTALESRSQGRLRESVDLFLELLDYRALDLLEANVHAYGRPRTDGEEADLVDSIVFFDENRLDIRLVKGSYSLENDSDLDELLLYAHGERQPDLRGMEVFQFLAELALHERTAVEA